ncbi:hypothetical protein LUZ60_013911 [Juncus effusus]|nr:hypothetical protein LUZ60_013911 [Juncus effusus]
MKLLHYYIAPNRTETTPSSLSLPFNSTHSSLLLFPLRSPPPSSPTMNGNQRSSASSSTGTNFNSYNFDFGLPSSRSSSSSRPLRGSSPSPRPQPAAQPQSTARPSWTHQPAAKPASVNPSLGPTSMVGDIFGKSWSSSAPSGTGTSSLGIPQSKNPNLFGDLFASALGSGRGSQSSAPLKSAAPAAAAPKSSFSMNNLSDSLPKSTDSGSNFPSFTGQPARSTAQSIGSKPTMGQPQKKDPFDSLSGFGSTQKPAPKPAPNKAEPFAFPTNFDDFQAPPAQQTFSSKPSPLPTDQNMDMFFSSKPSNPNPTPPPPTNEWDLESDFAAADTSTTTELEGLPPPPNGLTGQAAKSKGMENYKGGQFADAIKWLSWAFVILEKSGDQDAITEVLTCRASSYKEVGEYKKAIADCTKVLDSDKENVAVLTQRALLYESNEKYRLGAEDLRMVLKIDPGNRLARSTIHRLQKMAD